MLEDKLIAPVVHNTLPFEIVASNPIVIAPLVISVPTN
jgi:hypothetical protein